MHGRSVSGRSLLRSSASPRASAGARRRRSRILEALEPRQLLASDVVISEFMAFNDSGLRDEDNTVQDWIELYNTSNAPVNLSSWSLTDDPLDLDKWNFPSVSIAPKAFLVVFASGKDRRVPTGTLHTDFALNKDGGYLALVEADNVTVATEFDVYPAQAPNVSFGFNTITQSTTLVAPNSSAKVTVPSGSLPAGWNGNVPFDDSSWTSGSQGIGYDTGAAETQSASALLQSFNPTGYWRLGELAGATTAVNQGTAGAALNATYFNTTAANLNQAGPQSPAFVGFESDNNGSLFDGVDDYVGTTSNILANQNKFTVMGWVKRGTLVNTRIGLFGQNDTVEFGFSSPNTIELWTPATGALQYTPASWDSNWHHIAATGDGLSMRIYVDGVQVASLATNIGAGSYGTSGDAFRIGGGGIQDATGNPFPGSIDEVAAFAGTALSTAQIQQYYNASLSGGLGGQVDFLPLIQTNIQSQMLGVNSTALVRIPFTITGSAEFSSLKLNLQYDDGFVAYLNGEEVARANAPDPLAANSAATGATFDSDAVIADTFDLDDFKDLLQIGSNVLAIQALNVSASNPDLLLRAELVGLDVTAISDQARYFVTSSPSAPNGQGTQDLGPIITDVTNLPAQPTAADPVVVHAKVTQAFSPVSGVVLHYRRMFAAESTIAMVDNGSVGGDIAGDGIYTAVIPAGTALAGEMLRWYVTASDNAAHNSRWPLFLNPTASPQYLGTMIVDPATSSQLPIFNWFINPTDIAAANTRTGARAAVSFNGEFYDNVYVRMRGGTSAGFNKHSFKFEFNDGYHFRIDPDLARVDEINLNTTWTDKTYMRRVLSNEAYAAAGVPTPLAQLWRVEQNGDFYSVVNFIEQADKDFLRRNGLDDDGALYKVNNSFQDANAVEKKTRREEGNADIQSFATAVNTMPLGTALTNYLLDNLDVPEILSYLSAVVITHQNDHPHKNYFLYRDTEGSGEWQMFPQDTDLSFGKNYIGDMGGVLSDVMYADDDQVAGRAADVKPSHPFIGAALYKEWNNNWNRLIDKIINTPILQEMFLRRLRTVMDEQLQAPGTPADQLKFEAQIDALVTALTPDAAIDKARWANPWPWGTNQTLAQAVAIMKAEYLAVRRQHLFVTHSIDNKPTPPITFFDHGASVKFIVPADGSLDAGAAWAQPSFNDAGWNNGTTALYSEPDVNGPYLQPVLQPLGTNIKPFIDPDNNNVANFNGVYMRKQFNVADLSSINELFLDMRFDDGVAAYLNGTRLTLNPLARSPAAPVWNSTSTSAPTDAASTNYITFNITAQKSLLVQGDNVIAIHTMNNTPSDTDMLIDPRLRATFTSAGYALAAGIPHAQDPNVQINFGAVDFNPASGNQDEEYIQLVNPNNTAVDISGWELTGGITHTFRPGTIIPSNSSLYVSPDVVAFRARASGPRGNQGLLVQGGYNGHISNLGEVINLVRLNDTTSATITTPNAPSEPQQFLRITEIMYHPQDPNPPGSTFPVDEYDYIELKNIGAGDLDLTGVHFSSGITFDFTGSEVTSLPAGGYVLVVRNKDAFTERYGDIDSIAGEFELDSSLSNGGEGIKLEDDTNSTILDFSYDDDVEDPLAPWYPSTDGHGPSLVIIDPLGPRESWDLPESWRPSTNNGGSPGADDVILPPSSIVGRHVFYNQSKFDGNSAAANASDDAAIATDKIALLPGGTASFVNYTSFNRGLNGIMVDIADLPTGAVLSASDFDFKVGNTDTPSAWAALAAAPTISVRANAGVNNSSRVTLLWPTGAALKQWLQVTVKANGNTGLALSDVFYFGNAVGESGNVAGDYSVSITDELLARNNAVGINPGATIINRFDYNRDGTVSVVDQLLARNNLTTVSTRLRQITVPSALSGSGLVAQRLDDSDIARGLAARSPAGSSSTAGASTAAGSTSSSSRLQPQELSAAYCEAESLIGKRRTAAAANVDSELLELLSTNR